MVLIKDWREFSQALIETKELDPLYDFTYNAALGLGPEWRDRFLMGLILFYDIGTAAEIAGYSHEDDFWEYVDNGYDRFKRGTARRHSKGARGLGFIRNLKTMGSPRQILDGLWAPTYTGLYRKIEGQYHGCGLGTYFRWKIMDYQDRVRGRPIALSHDEGSKYLPEEAIKGAKLLWPGVRYDESLTRVRSYINSLPYEAPGAPTRKCSYSEAETILCAIRGYINKTYILGQDILERHHQLSEFPELIKFLPPIINPKSYGHTYPLGA